MKKQVNVKIDKAMIAKQDQAYRQAMPEETSRIRENIEWSIIYSYNATDHKNPRVLLIGDSICNGYQEALRERISGRVNVTYWISSKCVTDPDYFRELSLVLHSAPCSVISFNNGLHSLTMDRSEWETAYRKVLKFIRRSQPDAKLVLTLCSPLRPAKKTAISRALNKITRCIADDEKLPVIDLFTPMDALDRKQYWSDDYHFQETAKIMQAKIMEKALLALLPVEKAPDKIRRNGSKTGPSGKIK